MAERNETDGAPRLLRIGDALAEFKRRNIRMGRTQLYMLRQRGLIAFTKIGGHTYLALDEIERFIRDAAKRADAERRETLAAATGAQGEAA